LIRSDIESDQSLNLSEHDLFRTSSTPGRSRV
jgi:hypothetical protein